MQKRKREKKLVLKKRKREKKQFATFHLFLDCSYSICEFVSCLACFELLTGNSRTAAASPSSCHNSAVSHQATQANDEQTLPVNFALGANSTLCYCFPATGPWNIASKKYFSAGVWFTTSTGNADFHNPSGVEKLFLLKGFSFFSHFRAPPLSLSCQTI